MLSVDLPFASSVLAFISVFIFSRIVGGVDNSYKVKQSTDKENHPLPSQ